MRNLFILLFLIISYNFLLFYITHTGLSPIPFFPKDPLNAIIVLSFNSVLFLAWLFGERHKLVTYLGYLFFVQILAISFIQKDPYVFVSDLVPVIFTLMLIVLFESPFEREQKLIREERNKLLEEIEKVDAERRKIEEKISEFKRQLKILRNQIEEKEKELKNAVSKEDFERKEKELKELKERLEEYERDLKKQKEKEHKLLEANRKLFQMLEVLGKTEEKSKGSKEIKELRKERKKLIKEVLELQELLEIYEKENKELRENLEKTYDELKKVKEELEKEKLEKEKLEKEKRNKLEVYEEILKLLFPKLIFTKKALEEFHSLDPQRKKTVIKELLTFRDDTKLEPLSTLPNVYKLKFSGGRIYITREEDKWKVLGILDSEDDKEKELFIKRLEYKV